MKPQSVITYLLSALALLLAASCQGDMNVESVEQIVVEGSIAEGQFPVVFVTSSVPMSTKKDNVPLENLKQHILNWARVSISDGERTVVLTGRINSRYAIPCYFTTGEMRGEAGKTYTIDVTYDDFHATATTTIPSQRPMVDSLTIEPAQNSDSLFSIQAHVSPQHSTGYYQFLVGVEGRENDFFPSFLGLYTDQNIASGATIPIYRSHNRLQYNDDTFYSNYHHGERVHIRFAAIEQQAYDFWVTYEKFVSMGNNFLFPINKNLPSNIRGGLGMWYGYSCSEYFVEIP